jgi:hypothetical protein
MGGIQGSLFGSGTALVKDNHAVRVIGQKNIKKEVSFNVLALGAVQTEMLEEAFPGYQAPIKANEMDYIFDFTLTGNIPSIAGIVYETLVLMLSPMGYVRKV